MDVVKIDLSEESGPGYLRLNPLKTDKVSFNVYNFQPWQLLAMHLHPENDEVFYLLEGCCIFYADDERQAVEASHAVYLKAGTMHAVLSCGQRATLLSIQGPQPVISIYGKGLEYFCPKCGLEAPVAMDTHSGDVTECPRCEALLKLIEAGEAFDAEIIEKRAPDEASA